MSDTALVLGFVLILLAAALTLLSFEIYRTIRVIKSRPRKA